MPLYTAGTVMSGSEGRVHVRIQNERFYIYAEDLGPLLFSRESVPLFRYDALPTDLSKAGGSAYLNRSGRAVIFELSKRCYQVPRDRFMGVALGEEISWSISEIVSDGDSSCSPSCPLGGDQV